MSEFELISLFAGCGGSCLGYKMAGGKCLLAVEWDDNAVATYAANFPETPIYHGDIAKLSVEECLKLTGLKPGQLDILDGSPPCQGFSTAGKRQFNDSRNQLFREYVRLLRGLQPKVFVMENVSGMVKGKMKVIFAEILRELKASGYVVKVRLMNAMYYGVPQSRQRLIFIGVRQDLKREPSHPKPQGRPVTVREAWAGLVNTEADLQGTKLTPLYQAYWKVAGQWGVVGKLNQNRRLGWDRCSKTLQQAEGNGGVYHPDECRALTVKELARLGSYSDSYQWVGSRCDAKRRIGNSVPPLFMKAIAEHIRENILNGATPQADRLAGVQKAVPDAGHTCRNSGMV